MIMDNRNNAAADFFELILSTLWMVNLIYFSDKSLSRISKYRKNIRLIVERLNVTVNTSQETKNQNIVWCYKWYLHMHQMYFSLMTSILELLVSLKNLNFYFSLFRIDNIISSFVIKYHSIYYFH